MTTLRRDEEVDLKSQHIYQEKESPADFSGSGQGLVADHGRHPEELLEQAAEGHVRTRVPDPEPSPAAEEETTPEVREWLEEEVPTGAELTEAVIVEAILHPEPEIVEVPEEPEDEQPDRRVQPSP